MSCFSELFSSSSPTHNCLYSGLDAVIFRYHIYEHRIYPGIRPRCVEGEQISLFLAFRDITPFYWSQNNWCNGPILSTINFGNYLQHYEILKDFLNGRKIKSFVVFNTFLSRTKFSKLELHQPSSNFRIRPVLRTLSTQMFDHRRKFANPSTKMWHKFFCRVWLNYSWKKDSCILEPPNVKQKISVGLLQALPHTPFLS